MKNIWNNILKAPLFLYCGLYTLATIVNSIVELSQGIFEDPVGNRHELDRAILLLIVVVAYELIICLKMKNKFLKGVIAYIPTVLLILGYVAIVGLTEELAMTAYRDVFINYTIGFIIVYAIYFVSSYFVDKHKGKSIPSHKGDLSK